MARLGDFIREECHPLGRSGVRERRLIGVSNEHGLHPSSRDASDDLSRYQRIDHDWFAYNPMRVNVGSIGYADDDSKIGFTSPDYVVFSCRAGLLPSYLLHFLKSDYGLEAVANQCSGAVRKRLYFAGLAEIELPIPSVAQQQEVIRQLDEAKAAVRFICEENSDRHELPKLKQAILQEAITGRLTADWRAAHPDAEPASQLLARIQAEKKRLIAAKKLRPEKPLPPILADEIPFDLPEGWEWCQLGAVGASTRGKTPKYASESYRVILNQKCVRWGNIELCHAKPVLSSLYTSSDTELFTRIDDLLVNSTGEGTIGRSSVVNKESVGFLYDTHVLCFRPTSHEHVSSSYLMLLINSQCGQAQINATKGAQTTKQTELGTRNLNNLLIPLPPLAEQTEIVAQVEGLMERCRELEAEIGRSRAHAAALLQAVLREAFAPVAAAPATQPVRPAIKPLAYLLQFLPALVRTAGGTATLDQLNRATACLFLPKADLLPMLEKISGPEARDHFAGFAQTYEEGAFAAALRTLLKAQALTVTNLRAPIPSLTLTDNLPPISPDIDADARHLAPLIERVPDKVIARSAPRLETPRAQEALLQLV